MEFLRQAWLVARFDFGTSLRNWKAVAAVTMYVLGAILCGFLLIRFQEEFGDKVQMARTAALVAEAKAGPGEQMVREIADIAGHLLDIPVAFAGFFFGSLFFLPLLVVLVGCDLVNAEVRNRSVRFSLLRCSRGSLLLGKLASSAAVLLVATVLADLVLVALAWTRLPPFDLARTAFVMTEFWLLTVVFGFCYLALAALVSTLIDSAMLSLIVLLGVLIAFGMLDRTDVAFLSPSSWKLGLLSSHPSEVLSSAVAFAAFGVAFLGLAWARLQRRDL